MFKLMDTCAICIENLILSLNRASKFLLITGSLLGVLLVISIASIIYDFITRTSGNRSEIFLSFSFRRNVANLFNVDQNPSNDAILCVYGIRSISTIGVIIFGKNCNKT